MNYPKISCLTITKGQISLLKRALYCFEQQTYPNKELVVVTDSKTENIVEVKSMLNNCKEAVILVHCDIPLVKLGALRNISIKAARGAIICQWDDDDEYHPNRLMTQYEFLEKEHAEVCFMSDQLQIIRESKVISWSNWHRVINNAYHGVIPGTVMMYKDKRLRYPPHVDKAEDTFFIYTMLAKKKKIAVLRNKGYLYLYQHHGQNTWTFEDHSNLMNRALSSHDLVIQFQTELKDALAFYGIDKTYEFQTKETRFPIRQFFEMPLCKR